MKKVLVNFYGKNNLGDDLFIKIITERYQNHFSVLLSENNRFIERIHNITVHRNKAFYLFCKVIEKLSNSKNLWLKLLARKHDLLLYIGGSMFIENNNLKKWHLEKTFLLGITTPYYILGSNVGPHKTKLFLQTLNEIFANAQDVCYRDHASYELFKDLATTRVASDIVFSLDISKYNLKNEKIAIFSIINCVNRFNKQIADKYDREIVNMTKRLVESGYKVVYMSFCKDEGDEIAIEQIILDLRKTPATPDQLSPSRSHFSTVDDTTVSPPVEKMSPELALVEPGTGEVLCKSSMNNLDTDIVDRVEAFYYNGNLEEALSLIATCEIVIATRFHATILGFLFSKKVLPIIYSSKTTNVLDDLNFIGDIVDINNIDKFNGNKFDFKNMPINNVDEQIKLAELQFQELDKVLVRRK